jgi:hypothetical protein
MDLTDAYWEESVFGNLNYPFRRGPITVLNNSLNPSVAFPQR